MNVRRALLPLGMLLMAGACTPYGVAQTARTVPVGERYATQLFTVVPRGSVYQTDSGEVSRAMPSIDAEQRFGLDDRSDAGLRINSFSGIIASYKRRIGGTDNPSDAATAVLLGAGFVNMGQHAHGEITLIRSSGERGSLTPYYGLRALQVLPLGTEARSDKPTVGVFGGTRVGRLDNGLSFELGVFYDRSALGLRRSDLVIVPSISIHTEKLVRLIRGAGEAGTDCRDALVYSASA